MHGLIVLTFRYEYAGQILFKEKFVIWSALHALLKHAARFVPVALTRIIGADAQLNPLQFRPACEQTLYYRSGVSSLPGSHVMVGQLYDAIYVLRIIRYS